VIDQKFDHPFRKEIIRTLNSGQSNSIILSGNVHDLFFLPGKTEDDKGAYVSLTEYLSEKWGGREDVMPIVYEPNRAIRFVNPKDKARMRNAWAKAMSGIDLDSMAIEQMLGVGAEKKKPDPGQDFDDLMTKCTERPATAISMLRTFCYISNKSKDRDPLGNCRVIIFIEWADMLVPESELSRMSEIDRLRLSLFQDWFSDPAFIHGRDSVLLLTESIGLMNSRLTTLPQVIKVDVPAPDETARRHFIEWFEAVKVSGILPLWSTKDALAQFSAGLNLQALSQLLKGAIHDKTAATLQDVIARVEMYIKSQLGEGVVEFKQPFHTMNDVVGCRRVKALFEEELIPRLKSMGDDALTGIGVGGPIGGGKTFLFEALAAALGMPVLVLKSIRSQWFGQTDVILEKLYRVLISLPKVMIFIDEADTVFGGVGENAHETERRLTGTIQGWMSDTRLRGKVVWLLMTARIHLLSPDMRRPERLGIILPILDPTGEDHNDFLHWTMKPVSHLLPDPDSDDFKALQKAMEGYSAAAFKSLRSELSALKVRKNDITLPDVMRLVKDQLPSDIKKTREYQILQALMNTTRRSLYPNPENAEDDRENWAIRIQQLEAEGVR